MTKRLLAFATTVGTVVVLWVAPAAAGIRNM
ncbi:MAG: hypothetical protein JWL83_1720 [Actinomycetia bacterium]|nr:hypothetical protein [Actinomycetes bacterium]